MVSTVGAKLLILAIVRAAALLLQKRMGPLPRPALGVVPLVLMQLALLSIVTEKLVSSYSEYGSIAGTVVFETIGALFANVAVLWLFDRLAGSCEAELRAKAAEAQLEIQGRFIESIQVSYDDVEHRVSSIQHDVWMHVKAIKALLGAGCYKEAEDYAASFMGITADRMGLLPTHCPAINSMLFHCKEQADAIGAEAEFEISAPGRIGISKPDTTVILGNTIKNALEAVAALGEGRRRYIHITLTQSEHFFFYEIANSCGATKARLTDLAGTIRGHGLVNVANSVKKCGGEMSKGQHNGVFTVTVKLPLSQNEGHGRTHNANLPQYTKQ